jgi:hypothetical protein
MIVVDARECIRQAGLVFAFLRVGHCELRIRRCAAGENGSDWSARTCRC